MTEEGLLDDTVVILFSDHGFHMFPLSFLLGLDSVEKEKNMPGLFINLPPGMN
jgi:arylsulfatase A-like enzyme